MYKVVEFNEEAGGGLAVVYGILAQNAFVRALKGGDEVDGKKWKLYGIEKTYYETGNYYYTKAIGIHDCIPTKLLMRQQNNI